MGEICKKKKNRKICNITFLQCMFYNTHEAEHNKLAFHQSSISFKVRFDIFQLISIQKATTS